MRINLFHNLKLRIDLDKTLIKKLLRNELVRPICKFVKLVTKINNKVQEFKTYNKAINNPIYKNS